MGDGAGVADVTGALELLVGAVQALPIANAGVTRLASKRRGSKVIYRFSLSC